MTGHRVVLLLLAVASAPVVGAAAQTPPPPVFGVSIESVYVDAFVTRHGLRVTGLHASDFELEDNSVVQSPELLATDATPLLATLAFDTSGSVRGEKLAALRAAGNAFLGSLRPSDAVGLLTFRQEIEWRNAPTTDRDAMRTALGQLKTGGPTSLLDALYVAMVMPGAQTRSLVVLFSDGRDNLSWLDESQVRQVAERANALVHVVAIRPRLAPGARLPVGSGTTLIPEPEYIRGLRQIAEATGGRLWWAESFSQLTSAFAAIGAAMNERYVLRYEPQGVTRAGWHRIQLRLRGGSGDVQARHGYWIGSR